MKYEWKKQEKDIYLPKVNPVLIDIPEYQFLTISGVGDPNQPDFSERIRVLYSLAYALKMSPRKNYQIENFTDYTVYPLEGLWTSSEGNFDQSKIDKTKLKYKIMIRQPDFIKEKDFTWALEAAKKKKFHHFLDELKFEKIEDGRSVQLMHLGSYDDESKSFKIMSDFMDENKLIRRDVKFHREIYLSDFRKVEKDKLKTVLRIFVK